MMLDQCRRDFSALIDRINVQDAFEKADYKDRWTSSSMYNRLYTLYSWTSIIRTRWDQTK